MIFSVAEKDVATMNVGGSVSLLVKPAGPAGEALQQALQVAGLSVRIAPTVFDVVTEAQRAGGALRYLFVGVDHWGPSEFRLLPLVRREWPGTTIVAFHSPGFAYKGRVAELVGADAVLGNIDEIVQFVESLAAPVEPEPVPEPAPQPQVPPSPAKAEAGAPAETSPPVPVAAPPAAPQAARPPASPLQSIPMIQPRAHAPQPASQPPAHRTAPPQPESGEPDVEAAADEDGIDGEVIGTIELTEEELRLLLGEDEEA